VASFRPLPRETPGSITAAFPYDRKFLYIAIPLYVSIEVKGIIAVNFEIHEK
jgi:hypothetical protein